MFPALTPAQVERVRRHGRLRPLAAGEVLYDAGAPDAAFYVVLSGRVDIVRPSIDGETAVQSLGPGQFTGEITLLARRRPLVRAQATGAGEAIELGRDALLALVQTDSELSEILMRAFILRRV